MAGASFVHGKERDASGTIAVVATLGPCDGSPVALVLLPVCRRR
jgi:hypothetical protein